MAESKDRSKLFLRNYPDDDALHNPENYPKTLSFSPDIIPLYGTKANKDALTHDASWRGFTGMPIVGGDVNHVYIRGHGSGGPYVASLRAFPSELILWPHVWSNVEPVSSGPVAISCGDTPGRYASEDPLWFRPPHDAGNACSLVAHVFKLDPANAHGDLKDFEPLPSFDAQTFDADDLFSFLSKNDGLTFYNVIVADPTSKHVAAHTRLRMFSKSSVSVHFRVDWHKGAPVPAGLQVSLHDDHGKIVIPRTPLLSFEKHQPFSLDPGYDGHLTLKIHRPEHEDGFFEPYSGLSLKVFKAPAGSKVLSAEPNQLMGALNVLFDPHSTRNIRFASPSACELRESKHCPRDEGCQCPKPGPAPEKCTVIPQTKPEATGWWFRDALADRNHFPHTSQWGSTPDIQPIGTDSNLTSPGIWDDLKNPNIDYASQNQITLVGNANNYVFIRGHSTMPNIDVQARLFAIRGTLILHPSQYTSQGIPGFVLGEDRSVNQQSISVEDDNQFYLFNRPLDVKAPPSPEAGYHYCFIAEVRQKRKCSPVYPSWPSDQFDAFRTVQDFAHWVPSCPLVCTRNINWVPYKRKDGEKCFTWTCGTPLVIPDCSFRSSFWTLIIECNSPIIPPGSRWTLTCDDNEIFPDGVCFEDRPINTQSPAFEGCHFTGAKPGSEPKLTLRVTWCDNDRSVPPPSVKFRLALTEINKLSPVMHLAQKPIFESDNWWLYVGSKYPYIGLEANPSPLPTFASTGRYPWEYQNSPEYVVGQIALTAKEERA
ncbi:hypothetical protein V8E55_006811 [Tylopilus felleus]